MGAMSNYSVGGRILDLYDDVYLEVLSRSPHFEKVASLPMGDPEKIARLGDNQFAVAFLTKKGEVVRKYPIHDYPHTVLANVYFEMTSAQLPVEAKVAAATRIKEASRAFGIEPFSAVKEYAVDAPMEGRHYVPLHKAASRETFSVDVFQQLRDEYEANRDRYSRTEKVKLAEAMAGASEKFGLEMPEDLKPYVIKNAALDKEALLSQCALRKDLVAGRPEARHLLDEFIQKQAEFEPEEAVKLLETFDRQFSLDGYWNRGLEPRLVLREKEAAHAIPIRGFCDLREGDLKAFVSKNSDLLQTMFGKDFAQKVKEDPKHIWDLPEASRQFIAARIEHDREQTPVEAV